MRKPCGIFILASDVYDVVYAPGAAAEIGKRVNLIAPPQTPQSIAQRPELLRDVDVLFSGWGTPRIDEAFLEAAPNLKAIFYAAGSTSPFATPAMWDRGIVVTTASEANAIPVVEYTVATILFSLKHGWRLARNTQNEGGFALRPEIPGNYRSVIGLVGLGTIGLLVARVLRQFNATIAAYDPFLSHEQAEHLGVQKMELPDLLSSSDVVSLHAPDVAATRGMITGDLLTSMKPYATFINTSRGRLVREDEMIEVLRNRPDLQAVLDVTEEEPLPPSSPLNTLPNVVRTPHIAGSQGRECQRMGEYMVQELDRYLSGDPLQWEVNPVQLEHSVSRVKLPRPQLMPSFPRESPFPQPSDRATPAGQSNLRRH